MSRKGRITRRGFGRTAAAAAAAPLLARLAAARRAFAGELAAAELAEPGRGLRHAYSIDPAVTYLNHASIGTVPRRVTEAHCRYLEICESNPWLHVWGGEWDEPLRQTRAAAARRLGCDKNELAIVHNTTEVFNLLAQGLPLGRGDEVLMSSLNHTGATVPWLHRADERGFQVRHFDFPLAEVPRMSRERLLELYDGQIRRRTRALVFPHLDNAVGLRHPARELAELAHRRGVRFVAVDGAQSVGMLPVDVASLGVDVYATSAHKWLQAPKGLGLVYVRSALQRELRPMHVTWGQERWRGSARVYEDYGTRAVPALLALGDAVAFQEKIGAETREAHHRRLWRHARAAADRAGVAWLSPTAWELAGALYSVAVPAPAADPARRLFRRHGIVVRPFDGPGQAALRLSPNLAESEDDLDRFFAALEEEAH